MTYSVGVSEQGTTLTVGSRGEGMTSTLTMNEDAAVQLIRLLAATLYRHDILITTRHQDE